jgi:hypothetical protein
MADLASGAESKGVMAARVTLRTKILMAAGFVLFAGGPLALWWLAGSPPRSIQDQCAAQCSKIGRAYTLVPKDAPMTGHGERQMECRCAP